MNVAAVAPVAAAGLAAAAAVVAGDDASICQQSEAFAAA